MTTVSVMITAYNFAEYIEDAVQGALMQKGVPDLEIVIGEDCSQDETRELLMKYERDYPDIVRVLCSDENLGSLRNYHRTLMACRGKYIAMLDGDDYWTADDKLRTQLDFMESRPDFSICFHDAWVCHEDGSKPDHLYVRAGQKAVSTLEDLLLTNFIPTCSVFFRNTLISEFPEWYFDLRVGDYPLHVLNAEHGKIGYIDRVMGVYRVHQGSFWSMIQFEQQLMADIELYRTLKGHLGKKYWPIIEKAASKRWEGLAQILRDRAHIGENFSTLLPTFHDNLGSIQARIKPSWRWTSKLLGQVYMDFAFENFHEQDFSVARNFWLRALASDPGWLTNRGALSIGRRLFSLPIRHNFAGDG